MPVFDCVDKTFPLDGDHLNNLGGVAGLTRFKGKVPSGSMVLVGYTASWWRAIKTEKPRLGFNPNWVVVLGIPK